MMIRRRRRPRGMAADFSARERRMTVRTVETQQRPPLAATARPVVPYAQRKSRRGRKKSVKTAGYACPDQTWLTRAGLQAQSLQDRTLRALHLTHVQLDELRFKLHGVAKAAWLWVACDAQTKLIPSFCLGPQTQAMAHQLIPGFAQRLAPGGLPAFFSDGLALYFYALTAHFGQWAELTR